jgi:hypothetical protein
MVSFKNYKTFLDEKKLDDVWGRFKDYQEDKRKIRPSD